MTEIEKKRNTCRFKLLSQQQNSRSKKQIIHVLIFDYFHFSNSVWVYII